ncbi:hypothetical protein ACHHYP_13794 [Achlya hypogyna]|uniref:Helicase-associated domain-containing protein n=1 Tax=Achlya hypogyna TaxID=1202772 RepID=A0A1V9YEK6_ACHHY|nr:hypothetical protein ACHHYP_13794 [Achlya hypogyna]
MMLGRAAMGLPRRRPLSAATDFSKRFVTRGNASYDLPKRQVRPQRKVWATTVLALERFKELHGNLQVPQAFKIEPGANWPEDTWDLALGRVVNNLRTQWKQNVLSSTQKHDLERLGFPFTGRTTIPWPTKLLALKTFRALHGHVNVPIAFVATGCDWPPVLQGLKLGKIVNSLRNQLDTLPTPQKQELDALGFVWSSWERTWAAKILALETYAKIHGDLLVPRSFVVPTDDGAWPEDTWGLKLGLAVNNIRGRPERLSLGQVEALAALDFPWDASDVPFATRIRAWTIYEALHDSSTVPEDFVVPRDDPAWPPDLWNVPLGRLLRATLARPERLTVDELLELHERGYTAS